MLNLIPKPASVTPSAGGFTLSAATKIITADAEPVGELLAELIEQYTKFKPIVRDSGPESGNIHLKLIENSDLGGEGYELSIQPDAIHLSANQPAGLFYGVQTFHQILSAHLSTFSLPAVSITSPFCQLYIF